MIWSQHSGKRIRQLRAPAPLRTILVLSIVFLGPSAAPAIGQVPLRTSLNPISTLSAADSAKAILALLAGLHDTVSSAIRGRPLNIDPGPYPKDSALAAALLRVVDGYESATTCGATAVACDSSNTVARLDVIGLRQVSAGGVELLFSLDPRQPPSKTAALTPSPGSQDWMRERSMELLLVPYSWPGPWVPWCGRCAQPSAASVTWNGHDWQLDSVIWWRPVQLEGADSQ